MERHEFNGKLQTLNFRKVIAGLQPDLSDSYTVRATKIGKQEEDFGAMFAMYLHTQLVVEKLQTGMAAVSFDFPLNWWEHFKLQVFPKWLKKRFPVKIGEEKRLMDCTAWEVYPRFPALESGAAKDHFTIYLDSHIKE